MKTLTLLAAAAASIAFAGTAQGMKKPTPEGYKPPGYKGTNAPKGDNMLLPAKQSDVVGKWHGGNMVTGARKVKWGSSYLWEVTALSEERVAGKNLPTQGAQDYYLGYLKVEQEKPAMIFDTPEFKLNGDELAFDVKQRMTEDEVIAKYTQQFKEALPFLAKGLHGKVMVAKASAAVPVRNWWYNTSTVKTKHWAKYQRNVFLQEVTQLYLDEQLGQFWTAVTAALADGAEACAKEGGKPCKNAAAALNTKVEGVRKEMQAFINGGAYGDAFRKALESAIAQNKRMKNIRTHYQLDLGAKVTMAVVEIGIGVSSAASAPVSGPTAILGIIAAADGGVQILKAGYTMSLSAKKSIRKAAGCYQTLSGQERAIGVGRLFGNFAAERIPVFGGKHFASPGSCEEKLDTAWGKVAGVYARTSHAGKKLFKVRTNLDLANRYFQDPRAKTTPEQKQSLEKLNAAVVKSEKDYEARREKLLTLMRTIFGVEAVKSSCKDLTFLSRLEGDLDKIGVLADIAVGGAMQGVGGNVGPQGAGGLLADLTTVADLATFTAESLKDTMEILLEEESGGSEARAEIKVPNAKPVVATKPKGR